MLITCFVLSLHLHSAAVDCGPLSNPGNGQVMIPSGSTFTSTATYSCAIGYILNGVMTRTCGDGGIWTSNEPTCDRKFIFFLYFQG